MPAQTTKTESKPRFLTTHTPLSPHPSLIPLAPFAPLAICIICALCTLLFACGGIDYDRAEFISTSGTGSITINSTTPQSLGRMAVVIKEDTLSLYLFGGYATIDSDATLMGSGIAVLINIPNGDNATSLEPLYSTVEETLEVSYSKSVNYDDEEFDNSLITFESGSVLVRQNGDVYSLSALGRDSYGDDVIINYMGYILMTIVE